jgi:hypothetical protein
MSDTDDEPTDDELFDELRVTVQAFDGVPARLAEQARAAFAWRTIDQELAELQFDSLVGSDLVVRSTSTAVAHLSFVMVDTSIEVDLSGDAIDGQVVPAVELVVLQLPSGEQVELSCDEHGQFSTPVPRSGPVRLLARRPGLDVVTEWFTV